MLAAESTEDEQLLLPPAPTEPQDSECCGTGCTPCVFDIYKKQLMKWETECSKIRTEGYAPNANIEIETNEDFISPEKYNSIEIKNIIQETENSMKIFHFSCPENFKTVVGVGQHVLLQIEEIPRQYTILKVNATTDGYQFQIIIKIYEDGSFTQKIGKLVVGDAVGMRGPFGRKFEYQPNKWNEVILIACGTGIAPMYRLVQKILENELDDSRVRILWSIRSIDEVPTLLLKDFKEFQQFWNFSMIYFLPPSKAPKELPYYGMKIRECRLNYEELKLQLKIPSDKLIDWKHEKKHFVVCGTKSFEKDIVNYLNKFGVPEECITMF